MPARRTLALDAVIAVGIACSVLVITALAHSGGEAYPTRWERDQSVAYRFDGKIPGDFKGPVNRAAKQWNKVHASMSFKKAKGKANAYPTSECGSRPQDNVMTERSLGGPLAVTTWCLFDGTSEIYSFQIAFEKDLDWYTGKGNPDPGTWDVFSVALHELGHASGRSDHYRDGADECEQGAGETMCAS